MKRFKDKQRVIVKNPTHPMVGETGTVCRLRRCDEGAWVNMDRDLPGDLRSFPENDSSGRKNHTILYPSDCEVL